MKKDVSSIINKELRQELVDHMTFPFNYTRYNDMTKVKLSMGLTIVAFRNDVILKISRILKKPLDT